MSMMWVTYWYILWARNAERLSSPPKLTPWYEYIPGTSFSFFFPSHLLSWPFFSLPPVYTTRNSDPGPHTNQALLPPPTNNVRALHVYRGKISALSPLVDWRRIAPTHAGNRRSHHSALDPFYFLSFLSNASHNLYYQKKNLTLLIKLCNLKIKNQRQLDNVI